MRDQRKAAGVAFFMKQLGAACYKSVKDDGSHPPCRAYDYRDAKGGDPSEWPEDLRVREFPAVTR